MGICPSSSPALPPYTPLDFAVLDRLANLPAKNGEIMAEYIWLGGALELRCKSRTLTKPPRTVADLPLWNYDGLKNWSRVLWPVAGVLDLLLLF
jgi:hypothetical protein